MLYCYHIRCDCLVTEEEVYKGVLSQQNPNDHTLCFVREIYDIDYSHSKVERFVELEDGRFSTVDTRV